MASSRAPVRFVLRIIFASIFIFEGYFGLFPDLSPAFLKPAILSDPYSWVLSFLFSLVFLVTGASIATGVYPKQSSILATSFLGLNLIIALQGSGIFSEKEFDGITDTAQETPPPTKAPTQILDLQELDNIHMGIGGEASPE